ADCASPFEAGKHIGETTCVTGQVVAVKQGSRGVHYLDFCEDYRTCPFTVVVFPYDLRQVGDVRQLPGRTIEIHGEVKSYDGRAEIILSRARQLRGESAKLPPMLKNYDVERRGSFSAGTSTRPKSSKKTRHAQGKPVSNGDLDAEN